MTEAPSGNPFASEEAWSPDTSGDILGPGDYVLDIQEVDGMGMSSGGYPQVEVRCGNSQGSVRDWIVVIPATVGKVVQLFDAAELDRPDDEQVTVEGKGWRFDNGYLDQLIAKKVGVIVREEPDHLDPTRMKTRVKGYVKASEISTGDVPGAMPGEFEQPVTAGTKQDDFPF